MSRTPDSPAAPNAYAQARPTKHALAPSASAFNSSRRGWTPQSRRYNLCRSMFARLCQVNQQLLRDLNEDQVQHLCTAISILRNTATQLNKSISNGAPINSN